MLYSIVHRAHSTLYIPEWIFVKQYTKTRNYTDVGKHNKLVVLNQTQNLVPRFWCIVRNLYMSITVRFSRAWESMNYNFNWPLQICQPIVLLETSCSIRNFLMTLKSKINSAVLQSNRDHKIVIFENNTIDHEISFLTLQNFLKENGSSVILKSHLFSTVEIKVFKNSSEFVSAWISSNFSGTQGQHCKETENRSIFCFIKSAECERVSATLAYQHNFLSLEGIA